MDKIKYAAKNMSWTVIGKSGAFALSFFVISIFAYFAPKEVVGSYNFITSIAALLAISTLTGNNISLVRSVGKGFEGTLSFIIKKRMRAGLIGSLISVLISIWYLINGNTTFFTCFIILAFFIPIIEVIAQSTTSFWLGKKDYKKQASIIFIRQLMVTLLIFIPILTISDSIILITLSFFSANTISGLIVLWMTKRKMENKDVDAESAKHGLHFSYLTTIDVLSNNLDKIVIWHFLGPVSLAIYHIAYAPIQKVIQLAPIQNLTLPIFSQKERSRELDIKVLKYGTYPLLISIPAAIVLSMLTPFIYSIFFPKYPESILLFQVLTVLIALMPLNIIGTYLMGTLQKKRMMKIKSFSFILKIILIIIMVQYLGLLGAILSIVITMIITKILLVFSILKK